jgi:CBS domain-containing protein
MTTARDLMSEDVTCIRSDQTLVDAARLMRDLDVGALPICGADDRIHGMLTDRDIVVGCVADNGNPATTRAAEFAAEETITVGADDPADEILRTMAEHQVRRLPVIDGHRLVGIVSQADVARSLDGDDVGATVAEISQ